MSVRLKGIDLNCEAIPIDGNQESCFVKSSMNETPMCDTSDSAGFSVDGPRVLGEVIDSSNSSGVVKEELKVVMNGVNRDEVVIQGVNRASASRDVLGVETAKSDGHMDVEMRGVHDDAVVDKTEIDQNQEMMAFQQNSYNQSVMSLVVDLNLHHEEEICNEAAEVNVPFYIGLEGNVNTSIQDTDCITNRHGQVQEVMTIGQSNDAVEMDVKPDALIPKTRANENQIEKEGEFCLSDLVWGKVRSHPWWPGQIIDPSAASEKAMKYVKKDSYLIAYFGDQTFAWNEASKIKPFRMYFPQMKKQSNVDAFCDAVDGVLDEVSRRVEFGLACQCLPEYVLAKVKSQAVRNAGVQEKSTTVYGGDSFSTAASFFPAKFMNYLKTLAETPQLDYDVLEFITARAQFLAFNRWKGNYQLPAFQELNGILGYDFDLHVSHEEENLDDTIKGDLGSREDYLAAYGKRKSPSCDVLHVRKHKEFGGKKKKQRLKLISGSSSSFPNGLSKFEGKAGSKEESVSSSKKHKTVGSASSERRGRKSGRLGSQEAVIEDGGKIVEASRSGASTLTLEKFRMGRTISQVCPAASEMLLKLSIAAASPMDGYHSLASIAGVLCDFRNSIAAECRKCKENTSPLEKLKTKKLSNSTEIEFEGMEDSYWTDRIIQSSSDGQVLFEPATTAKRDIVVSEREYLDNTNVTGDDRQEVNAAVTKMDVDNSLPSVDGNSNEYSPTTLILNFTDLESVPSIANLNQIFHRFGPLEESQTEVLSKSKRAKLVFKRRFDAETAFSSAGKFSIFGPSLVSYRLKYKPSPPKPWTGTRKSSRKNATSVEVSTK